MDRVWTCLTQEHDAKLVVLAAVICIGGAFIGLGVLRRAAAATARARAGWLVMGGMTAGSAVWCTHFVAMLAYEPAHYLGFQPLLTLASLVLVILSATAGFALAISSLPAAAMLGGAVFGLGASAMHYTGMEAFGANGILLYDLPLLTASVLLSVLLCVAALSQALTQRGGWDLAGAVLLFCLGIVALHFTGMGAVLLLPLPYDLRAQGNGHGVLALAIGLVALMVMSATAAAWLIDHQNRAEDLLRMRRLVDSAIEGLAVIQDDRIVEANASLQALTGLSRTQLMGQKMPGDLLPVLVMPEGEATVETQLRRPDGSLVDVELVVRENVPLPGKRVFALRDLRERREQERRLRHLALHDALTGLPNRSGFGQQIDPVLRDAGLARRRLALLRIGLNRFKEINDLHGHSVGDALLRDYAAVLAALTPPGGLTARLGGDEFVLLLPFAELHEVQSLAASMVEVGTKARPQGSGTTAAIGIALFPDDAGDAEALMANADVAMRRAKSTPAADICFYQARMDAVVRDRRRLADDLRMAPGAGQLSLHYQRQVETGTGRVSGHEALMRWQHPVRGFVSPAEFIPVAEATGLILMLGEWALRTACVQAVAEPRLGKVAVNLSPVQFRQPGLPALVADVLRQTGLPPSRLELEITESTLMQDPARTLEMLREIKSLGVSVAMDDFGTGHSSLATLRAFPFDKIKLDRSFMPEVDSNQQARAILRAVLGIGRGLGIPVLAEGVETSAVLDSLRDEGCAEAQGYLLGRPLPVQALDFPDTSKEAA
ncbi:EAL domain-containing protein [Pseudoroseomonas globiformis]|uniref:EAL domain-containing protein n=1 Tax=Teichococcus globiformis TaxID=2307229 RepID=A0ABV7G728_9PROT